MCRLPYRFPPKMQQPTMVKLGVLCFVAFKENIQTTPTKAGHAGMPPTLLQQANDECDQLVKQGVV
ncbi:unnamed protein product [Brassica oleracea]